MHSEPTADQHPPAEAPTGYLRHQETGQVIRLDRMARRAFRRKHGQDGKPLSGRQFRKARKRGQRQVKAEPQT